MSDLSIASLLTTRTAVIRDVVCGGACKHKSPEECSRATTLVFAYRGLFRRHVGSVDAIGEANQVLFFNRSEAYQVSHPVEGGDGCLAVQLDAGVLDEMMPPELRATGGRFRLQSRGIDARSQVLVALLRHGLKIRSFDTLEAEALTLTLLRRVLGERTGRTRNGSAGRRKIVDRAKLVMSADLSRRWTLTEIAGEVGVSPVYLTQLFREVEQVPLYRYHVGLRLARALDLLPASENLTQLGLELGFSSHSHFSTAFKKAYGRTPAEFQRSLGKHR